MSFDLKLNNGDLVLNNGDLDTVQGTDKLVQDILKIALTTAGSNPMNPWYGSFLSKAMIGSVLDADVTVTAAQSYLQTSLETLKKLQQNQIAQGFQPVDPSEQLAAIVNVSILQNNVNPTLYAVMIKVLTKAFTNATASFTVNNF